MTPTARSLLASLAALAAAGVCGAGTLAASSPTDAPSVVSTVPPDDSTAPGASTADGVALPDVGQAGEISSTAPYRLEMFMEASIMGMTIDGDTPLATGEFSGEQSHLRMDLGAMFGDMIPTDQMPEELQDVELVMEFVADGTDLYIRAPFFSALGALGAGGDPATDVFTQLGDGWGYVDGTAVPGVDAGSLTGMVGIGGADPAALFQLLSGVEGAEQIGTADIRGVSTIGVRAEVNLAELMEAQGTPAASTGTPFGDATFPIELWIDKDNFVRRIVMNMDGEAMADAVEASGQDVPADVFSDTNTTLTMEMFDYNATDIAIEIPTEFTDITEDFAEVMAQQPG